MSQAKKGDRVKIHYAGKTKSGQEFDSTQGEEPIELQIGNGDLWPSIETALVGMNPGDKKTIELPPEEAIPYVDDLVFEVQKSQLPDDIPLEEGTLLQLMQPDGNATLVKIVTSSDDTVTIDANHPLAGEELSFALELVEICK